MTVLVQPAGQTREKGAQIASGLLTEQRVFRTAHRRYDCTGCWRFVAVAETIQQAIIRGVKEWPGVTTGPHRFGGVEIRHGRRELGHLHGDRLADLPFPRAVRNELIADGRAEPHHIHPESGWVSCFIRDASDVPLIIALFRLNYERPWRSSRR